MDPRFSYVHAASPLHDEAAVAQILGGLSRTLARAGGTARPVDRAPLEEPLVYVVLTGGTERSVLDLVQQRRARGGVEPVLLVAHGGHNSLAAAMEILARLRLDGRPGRISFLEGGETDAEALKQQAHLCGVPLLLSQSRLGAVGAPSDWLVASAHDAQTVKSSWGPQLVEIPLAALFERVQASPPDTQLARELASHARQSEVPPEEIARATSVYAALEGLVTEHRLWALTVRCFDLVTTLRTTGCFALSRLSDDGVPAGCEGDVPSAVALLWLFLLTGDVSWMANPARVSIERGEIVLAHCTVPRKLVGEYDVRTHFESGLGVALAGDFAQGPVTLVRLGGARLEELWCCEGQLSVPERDESLCRTQVCVETDCGAVYKMLERPLGNHVVVLPGHREDLLLSSRELVLGKT